MTERFALKVLVMAAAVSAAGCTRTLNWEEEVHLNTGEMVVVQRSGSYSFGSAPGNPLDLGFNPDKGSSIKFEYRGKSYAYSDDATLVLLAIRADGSPNLIISAADYEWQWKHNYVCVVPSYVQLQPGAAGTSWGWLNKPETWLYGLPTNLVIGLPPLTWGGKRMSTQDRDRQNASAFTAGAHYRTIEAGFMHQNCKKRKD